MASRRARAGEIAGSILIASLRLLGVVLVARGLWEIHPGLLKAGAGLLVLHLIQSIRSDG